MKPTRLDVFNEWQFDCCTPKLLKEISECSGAKVYAPVWNIFTSLITQVAVRCTELHDPVLDAIMLRMGLYEVPAEDRRDMVKKCKEIYMKEARNETA